MKTYFVYIMTNKGRTVLYVGVTNSLVRRVSQHRRGETAGFTQRYNFNRLVYFEKFNDVRDAIRREKQIKGWTRKKKKDMIARMNPKWTDLAVSILGLDPAPLTRWNDDGGWKDQNFAACT